MDRNSADARPLWRSPESLERRTSRPWGVETFPAFPHDAEGRRTWPALLAILPRGAEVITCISTSQGSPRPSATIALSFEDAPWSGDPDAALERLLAFGLPDVKFLPRDVEAADGLAWRRLSAVPFIPPLGADRRAVVGFNEDFDFPLIAPASPKGFDLDATLSALPPGRSWGLKLRVSRVELDAPTLRALEAVKARAQSLRYRDGPDSRDAERLLTYTQRLAGPGAALRVEADLGFQGEPDEMAEDLVSLALFGAPADRLTPSPHRADLRDLHPLDLESLPILPSEVAITAVTASAGSRVIVSEPGGLAIGNTPSGNLLRLAAADRARHLYVLGGTGAGKSTFLLNLIDQDMRNGEGVIVLDPHGDLAEDAAALARRVRPADLIYCDASDPHGNFRLDILAGPGPDAVLRRSYAANALIRILTRVLYAGIPEAFGPVFESYFRNALMLLMDAGGPDATLLDFEAIFADAKFRNALLDRCSDPKVRQFWREIAGVVTHDEMRLQNIAPYITCKLAQFTGNPLLSRILCDPGPRLDLAAAMDQRRIVIIRMPKGLIGQSEAELLAALVVMRIGQAGMARASQARLSRTPVRLYIDEVQTCAGEGLSELLAESRKFGLSLVLANQSLGQMDGRGRQPNTSDAALANAANLVVFRLGAPDAARIAPWFEPEASWRDLCRLPDFHALGRVLQHGRPTAAIPLTMAAPVEL